jgi:hypothetical protein
MGAQESRPTVEVEDCYKPSVLLVHAPDELFGSSLAAGRWAIFKTVRVDIVRWDGRPLNADQHRSTVAAHHAVLYFFDPSDTVNEDVTTRLTNVLKPIIQATSATQTPIYTCSYGFQGVDDDCPQAKLPYEALVRLAFGLGAARPGSSAAQRTAGAAGDDLRRRLEYRHIGYEQRWLQLLAAVSMTIVPRKMTRWLANLARDLSESCGASDVVLFESSGCLPLLAHDGRPPSIPPAGSPSAASPPAAADAAPVLSSSERLVSLLWPIREMMLTNGEHAQRLKSIHVGGSFGDVYVGWAIPPLCYVMVVIPTTAGEAKPGRALVELNMAHYTTHFTNVVHNTTERTSFTPIVPP